MNVLSRISPSLRAGVLAGVVALTLGMGLLGYPVAYVVGIVIGLMYIVRDSIGEIRERRYSLDYIACVALVLALISEQYLAGAIVALMFVGGKTLETYATQKAEATLRALSTTIPKEAYVSRGGTYQRVSLQNIRPGESILIKRGELVPLDGTLASERAFIDFANLTGEAGAQQCISGTLIKSGAVNVGDTIEIVIVGDFSTSTYHTIVRLVDEAKAHPARLVRLSERANGYFTVSTLLLVVLAYYLGGIERALAVLVIATPCPLIIAAPVAFISGMSRAAKKGAVVRRPAILEALDRARIIFFDKTGTLTLGEPRLISLERTVNQYTDEEVLRVVAALEMHSLHPLSRALIAEATARGIPVVPAQISSEKLGEGIGGVVDGTHYSLTGLDIPHAGITLVLRAGAEEIARLHFADQLKEGTESLLAFFKTHGVRIEVITGDTAENAREVFGSLDVVVHADVSPLDKHRAVEQARKEGQVVAMVGDGLNDAPALARADVGIAFSSAENAASVEASDVVLIDRSLASLVSLFMTAHRTVRIARQSIYGGIVLSLCGMTMALLGYITPVQGALIQEAIDVVVILNALRVLRG